MTDIFLYAAGGLAMLVAVVHGWLGGAKVVEPSTAPNAAAKRILHAIMFLSAVYWLVAGAVLLATPHLLGGEARQWTVYACAAMLGAGALGNIWATRARHFGGYLLALITALALLGA